MGADPIGDRLSEIQAAIDGLTVSMDDTEVPVPAYTVLPERISPPFLYVFNDNPYVTPDEAAFGEVSVNFVVGFAARPGDNAFEVAQANQVIYGLFQRLTFGTELAPGEANVGRIALNGSDFFGATLRVAGSIPLQEA